MQQRLEILENLVSRTIGESSTQNLARQPQTHGACMLCLLIGLWTFYYRNEKEISKGPTLSLVFPVIVIAGSICA